MARNQKTAKTVLFVIAVISCGYWLCRFSGQNERLKQAERNVPQAMRFIDSGALRSAENALAQAEGLSKTMQTEWAAWPSIRQRERTLTSHIANLRVAHAKRLTLLDTTTLKVSQSVVSGRFEDAEAAIAAALREGAIGDQPLHFLNRMVDRLNVQDFNAASNAVQQSVRLLSREVPISDVTKKALPEMAAAVERERAVNRAAQDRIASDVCDLIDSRTYRESDSFRPVLKGRAMIWDATKHEVEKAYELLPDNLRASSKEGIVTILSVIKREQIVQGYYSVSKQPAYKEKMIIGVVYWPEKTSAGTVVVWGGDPAHIRPVTYQPGYGSSVNIKNWVESLPKQSDPVTAAATPSAPSADKGRPAPPTVLQPAGGGGPNGSSETRPLLERALKPVYPVGARRRGEEGTVIIGVDVSENGSAAKTSLVSSSGFPELDRAADRAAAAARFKPGMRDGKPVASAARLTLTFRLRDE